MLINIYPSMLQITPNAAETKLYKELREYLSLENTGAKFSKGSKVPKFANRHYFITDKQGLACVGFLPIIIRWLEGKQAPYELADCRGPLPEFNPDFDRTDGDITLRDYQEQAVLVGDNRIGNLPFPVGSLDLATNSGKTYIPWFIRKAYNNANMLILIPASSVFRQTVKEMTKLWPDEVGVIYGDKMEWKPVIISSPKTLYNKMFDDGSITPKMFMDKGYQLLMFDEMHLSTGKEFVQLLKKLPMTVRIGLSGTPMDHSSDVLKLRAIGNFGLRLMKVSKKDLMDLGISQRPSVKVLYVPPIFAESYAEAYENGIRENSIRASIIRESILANHKDECVLITCEHSVHAQFLYEALKDLGSVAIADSKDSSRHKKIDSFAKGETKVLISTMIVRVGLNLPLIRAVYMAQGGKNMISLSQVSGRGERNDGVHDTFALYDFMDDSPWLKQHSLTRIAFYHKEGFEVSFNYPCTTDGYPKLG